MEWIPFKSDLEKTIFIENMGFELGDSVRDCSHYTHPYFGQNHRFDFSKDTAPNSIMNTLFNKAFTIGQDVKVNDFKRVMNLLG